MRAIHVDDIEIKLVNIREAFEQADFTGVPRTLAYCETQHIYRHINRHQFFSRCPNSRFPVAPAGCGGYYVELSAELEAWLDACEADGDAAISARKATMDAAMDTLDAVPANAADELAQVNTRAKRQAVVANEGGEGYVPYYGWASRYGREIAKKYGLDVDALVAASHIVEGGQ